MNQIDYAAHAERRLALIDDLETGKLDKVAFIEATVALYNDYHIVFPAALQSVEEGLFYYQYYNALAKYQQIKFRQLVDRDLFSALDYRRASTDNYRHKERITKLLLSSFKDEPLRAYFVKVNSQQLRHKLVEIVFTRRAKVILHTLDKSIIALLRRRNCLTDKVVDSLIGDYINQPYYRT